MAKINERKTSPIGKRLKALRRDNNWTLSEVSAKTGISTGTLSRLENGITDLNFTSVSKLAGGLGLAVTELTNPPTTTPGLRSVTTGGDGVVFHTPDANYEILCSDVANQNQVYMKVTVTSRAFKANVDWHKHPGQEFIYVLAGKLELHTELYDPVLLKVGDSMLFDSSMGHYYVSAEEDETELLVSFSLKGYENVSDAILSQHKKL